MRNHCTRDVFHTLSNNNFRVVDRSSNEEISLLGLVKFDNNSYGALLDDNKSIIHLNCTSDKPYAENTLVEGTISYDGYYSYDINEKQYKKSNKHLDLYRADGSIFKL